MAPFFLILSALFLLSACGSSGDGGTITTTAKPFCSTVNSFSSPITITGTAQYQYRTNGNGAVNGTPNPVRLAEVIVQDAGGNTVQCGATDASGNFSVSVPNDSATLTLVVASRIISGLTQVYVLDNPSDKDYYSISTTFVADGSKSVGTLIAPATGTLEGGAFNILDKILDANEYLETETTGCSGSFATCIAFSQHPLASVYWTAGLNPGIYFNAGPVSFYLPGLNELYILGGVNGAVDDVDADHFDESIIIHEWGHFIEDVFSKTDSPGGFHNGQSLFDARLAWGEGWANFFQAAVFNNPVYRDTSGNVDGTPAVFFNENIETPGNDIPTTLGEGIFREFSISRALWDAIDSVNGEGGADLVTTGFNELWTVFAGSTGFASASRTFRNMGLFHVVQQSLAGASDWSSIRAAEFQRGDQTDYASGTDSGPCAAISIQAANTPNWAFAENGSTTNSNQFDSNDFYSVSHAGGAFNLVLSYTTDAGNQADLDIIVFTEGYNFLNSTGIAASATGSPAAGAGPHTEQVNTSLAAGQYLINVRVDTTSGLGNNTDYSMTLNGVALCPNN